MSISVAKSLAGFLLCCALAGTAQAGTIVVNTFDGSQTPPPGGLGPNAPAGSTAANGVHALGVTFGFTENGLASANATYGDTSIDTTGLQLAPLSSPVLLGDSDTNGVLTLTFDAPSTFLSFDIAFTDSIGPGGTVTINGTGKAFTTTANSGLAGLFSIGSFSWTPSSSFTQATIAFDNGPTSTQFAIDNLSYDEPAAASGTPEPATVGLLGGGMLAFGLMARKRR
jgi:hypothetical protein